MLRTGFNIQLTSTVAEGELIARGRVIGIPENHCLAEAVVRDSDRDPERRAPTRRRGSAPGGSFSRRPQGLRASPWA
jgi:hypothetical protein